MIWVVYIATNTATGSEYIGITKRGMQKRRREHLYDARKASKPGCWRLNQAIRKYGNDAFEWRVVAEGLTHAAAEEMERSLIASRKPRYNITSGGGGVSGIVRTPEANAKLHKPILCLDDNRAFPSVKAAAEHYDTTQSALGKVISFKRYSAAGRMFVRAAVPMEDDQMRRLLMREIADRRDVGAKAAGVANRRPVICVTTGERFESATEAASHFGMGTTYVAELCRNGRALDVGLRFRYDGEPEVTRRPKKFVRPLGIPVSAEARAKIGEKARMRAAARRKEA